MKKPESLKGLRSIKVQSEWEAWLKVDELFATDYLKDDVASENAGYPIYRSTLHGEYSWISNLGCGLELNFSDGDEYFESFKIWIAPQQTVEEMLAARISKLESEVKELNESLASAQCVIRSLRKGLAQTNDWCDYYERRVKELEED